MPNLRHPLIFTAAIALTLAAPPLLGQTPASTEPQSPEKLLANLLDSYAKERNTREWEILGGVGRQHWDNQLLQLAKSHPDLAQKAAHDGRGPWHEIVLTLGDIAGDSNIAFLTDIAQGKIPIPPSAKNYVGNNLPEYYLVLALGRTNSPLVVPALIHFTEFLEIPDTPSTRTPNDKTPRRGSIAYQALDALARLGDSRAVPVFEKCLASDDPGDRNRAVAAATHCSTRALADALRKADPKIQGDTERRNLYLALIRAGDETYLEKILAQALDESEYIRESAERSPDPAIAIFPVNWTQRNALEALEGARTPKSLPTLDQLAQSARDPAIKSRAAKLAAQIRKDAKP